MFLQFGAEQAFGDGLCDDGLQVRMKLPPAS
jgi:hypothetical protein